MAASPFPDIPLGLTFDDVLLQPLASSVLPSQANTATFLTREIPLGEIPPQEDIAESIVFFASDMARMITGQTLDVNGGEYFG